MNKYSLALSVRLICWKKRRCRKNLYDGLEIVNVNVTKIDVNCGLQNARCSVSKVETITLAFKWLDVHMM